MAYGQVKLEALGDTGGEYDSGILTGWLDLDRVVEGTTNQQNIQLPIK